MHLQQSVLRLSGKVRLQKLIVNSKYIFLAPGATGAFSMLMLLVWHRMQIPWQQNKTQ